MNDSLAKLNWSCHGGSGNEEEMNLNKLFISWKTKMTAHSRLASQRRQSHSSLPVLPFFPCLLLLSPLILLRDSLCTALQTEKLWIWSTGLSALLTPSFRLENWVPGNLSALMERSQLGIRGMRGRGGKSYVLRLFPWRTLKISTFSELW